MGQKVEQLAIATNHSGRGVQPLRISDKGPVCSDPDPSCLALHPRHFSRFTMKVVHAQQIF